jgi:glycosyltransferase involved in cell wall biosynthesis
MVKVSILIPTYNQPLLLKRALDSITDQNFKDFEVVITDDSTDTRVRDVAHSFRNLLDIRYYYNLVRLGSPANWNEGIRRASGDYIKFLHHDDRFIGDEALNGFVEALDENQNVDFVFSGSIACNQYGEWLRFHSATKEQVQMLEHDACSVFPNNFIGAPSATIYRRSMNLKFDEKLKWFVDVDFYIRALKQNPQFIFIPAYTVCCSSGDYSVTHECQNGIRTRLFEWAYVYSKIVTKKY